MQVSQSLNWSSTTKCSPTSCKTGAHLQLTAKCLMRDPQTLCSVHCWKWQCTQCTLSSLPILAHASRLCLRAPSVVPRGRRECSCAGLHCKSWTGRSERRDAILRSLGHPTSMGENPMDFTVILHLRYVDGTIQGTQFYASQHTL